MLKKYLKISIISAAIGFALAFVFVEFFSYKVKQELYTYQQKKMQIQSLADAYALCIGLHNANPSKNRRQLCLDIRSKVFEEAKSLEGSYPYISFYNKVFN
ncbi:hypothetical protein CRU98_00865 [Arcobacter sp. CECT 8986]|uniref:hypothetical protein n=1 Tax=Arcobacter sp. CECT 8986 TaxID=2044507 RepID=UPI001009F732|nr:hypothetical protein [Arcobacter sp. CECT 8986]RXK01036.1 hypothetical protein CRU98_00865 [Arcobacter sp. CECT 8986]